MSRDLMSKRTRSDFREAFGGFVLREIDMMFENAGLSPKDDFMPKEPGERRRRVEQYYANVDFASARDVEKVIAAYGELIEHLQKNPQADARVASLVLRMKQDGFGFENGRFGSQKLRSSSLAVAALVALTEESIREHIDKIRMKIEDDDYAGAITNTYTLVEEFLKEILRRTETPFKPDEGDIRTLYRTVAGPLNLNPAGENLEGYLKSILQGFMNQMTGLYEVANKAGDRHARRYNPAKRHAKLAMNAAFSLCEFLLDSFEYQREKKMIQKDGS